MPNGLGNSEFMICLFNVVWHVRLSRVQNERNGAHHAFCVLCPTEQTSAQLKVHAFRHVPAMK